MRFFTWEDQDIISLDRQCPALHTVCIQTLDKEKMVRLGHKYHLGAEPLTRDGFPCIFIPDLPHVLELHHYESYDPNYLVYVAQPRS